jgi:hypothetical protein
MKRLIIIALMLVAYAARAQNVSEFSTDVLALSASARPLSVYAEYDVSVKVTARRGSNPVQLTNALIRWTISDRRNGYVWRDTDGYVLDGTGGVALATVNLNGLEPGAYYQGALTAYDPVTTAKITDLSLNHINLTNWCDGCVSSGGGGTTIITQQLMIAIGGITTLVEATFSPINNFTNQLILSIGGITSTVFVGDTIVNNSNIVSLVNNIAGVQVFVSNTVSFGYAGSTSTPAFVRWHSGGVLATGVQDGANLDLYGAGGSSSPTNIVGVYPIVVTNIGEVMYISYGLSGGVIIIPPYLTNAAVFEPTFPVTNLWTVPAGVTQITVTAVAGAGCGATATGPGGGVYASGPVVPGESLTVILGRGGNYRAANSTTSHFVAGGVPNGGGTWASTNIAVGSAGAWFALLRGTNVLCASGGGGGNSGAGNSGLGGGNTGGNGTVQNTAVGGVGATQSAAGSDGGGWQLGGTSSAGQTNFATYARCGGGWRQARRWRRRCGCE